MKTLLIIDDDPILLRTMRAMLKDKYTVFITTTPNEALSILAKHAADLIMLDYDMPILNGLQTLKLIQENESYKNIPVVFLTGTEDKDLLALINSKSKGILQKPVKENTLFELLAQFL